MKAEEWIEIEHFPGYAVSNTGKVINTSTDIIKKPSKNQQGIPMVNLSTNGVQNVRSLALLVANTFLEPAFESHFDTPIHLDGDRENCCIDNLLWRPRWFAVRYHQQFNDWQREHRFGMRRPVLLEQTEEIFPTSWEAAIKYGMLDFEIFMAIVNQQPVFPYGYRFIEWAPEEGRY